MSDLTFTKLVVKNFKSFKGEHTFNLNQGPKIIYVTGINKVEPKLTSNGCGKTTFFSDALCWVLWNKTERDNRPASAVEPWNEENKICFVSITFSRLGKTKTITRSRNPNRLFICYESNGRGTEKEIVQDDVHDIIGMNEELFRNTVIFGQSQDWFLDIKPERQSGIFNESLSLSTYLIASELARKKQSSMDNEVSSLQRDIDRLSGTIDEIDLNIDTEKKSEGIFEKTRNNEMTELQHNIDEVNSTLEIILKHIDIAPTRSLVGRVKALQAISLRLAEETRSWRLLVRDTDDLGHDLAALISDRKNIMEEMSNFENSSQKNGVCPTCGQKVSVDHLEEKLEKMRAKKNMLDKQYDVLNPRFTIMTENSKELGKEIDVLQTTNVNFQRINEELKYLEMQLKKVTERTNIHEYNISILKDRKRKAIQDRREKKDQVTSLKKRIEIYSFWNMAFKEIRLGIIDDILLELEMTVTSHAEALGMTDWSIKFTTEKETKSGDISFSFTTYLYPPNQDEPVKWESYSGGESQRWQLSTIFGLSEILLERSGVSTNIEVLDEPTRGLSPKGIDYLLEHLRRRAEEAGRTIYFIDQHSLDKGDFDGVVTVTKTEEGSNIQFE